EAEWVLQAGPNLDAGDLFAQVGAHVVRDFLNAAMALAGLDQEDAHLRAVAAGVRAAVEYTAGANGRADLAHFRIVGPQPSFQLPHHFVGARQRRGRRHGDGQVDFALVATGEDVEPDATGHEHRQANQKAEETAADSYPAIRQAAFLADRPWDEAQRSAAQH